MCVDNIKIFKTNNSFEAEELLRGFTENPEILSLPTLAESYGDHSSSGSASFKPVMAKKNGEKYLRACKFRIAGDRKFPGTHR